MRVTWATAVGVLSGLAGAVVWAVSLAIYQPFMEPAATQTAENNTYWPRDMRQLAILLAVAGVLVLVGICRRTLLVGAGGALLWCSADLWLDRVGVSGGVAVAWLTVAGISAFAAIAAVAARVRGDGRAGRLTVHLVAGTLAVLAATTTLVTTPWDEPVTRPDRVRVEDVLFGLKFVVAGMLALVVVALVVPWLTAGSRRWFAGFTVVTVAAAWPATAAEGPRTLVAVSVIGLPVLATLAVTVALHPDRWRLIAVAVAGWCAVPVVFLTGYAAGSALGAALTSVANNPPVNSADSDLPLPALGLTLGLALALIAYHLTGPVRPVPTTRAGETDRAVGLRRA